MECVRKEKIILSRPQKMFTRYPTHMRGLSLAFLLILVQASSCTIVTGQTGRNVTLPCTYDAQTKGVTSFCWGHGRVPLIQCSDKVLVTQDGYVVFRKSTKYQLLGRVTEGDISLTILNAQRRDAGVYGCRVEFPGMFNDQKVNVDLIIIDAPVKQPKATTKVSTAERIHSVTDQQETFSTFLGVGNIGRMAAIFFFSIIIILVLIIPGRTVVSRGKQHLNTFTVENIYETAK